MKRVCLSADKAKHLLDRAWELADYLEREARHIKKGVEEVRKEIRGETINV